MAGVKFRYVQGYMQEMKVVGGSQLSGGGSTGSGGGKLQGTPHQRTAKTAGGTQPHPQAGKVGSALTIAQPARKARGRLLGLLPYPCPCRSGPQLHPSPLLLPLANNPWPRVTGSVYSCKNSVYMLDHVVFSRSGIQRTIC